MKKHIVSALALLAAISTANAQTSSTNVTINLSDFITTEAGNATTPGATPGSGSEIIFNYPNAAAYTVDNSVTKQGHLKVTATKVFTVKVKALGAHFLKGTDQIPVGVIDIVPTAPGSGTASTVTLSETDQSILTGVSAGIKSIDVKYTIPFARAQASILGKPSGAYQQVVVYTFSQP